MKRILTLLLTLTTISVMAEVTPVKEIKESVESLYKAYKVDADSLFAHVDSLKIKAEESDPVARSIYYSYIAQLYQRYYHINRFYIYDRTDIDGPAAADPREWTKRNFYDTIRAYVDLSVAEREALLKADIADYRDILDEGKDSLLRPTMYDILMHQAIDVMDYDKDRVAELYETLIEAHKDEPLPRDAAKLDYMAFKQGPIYAVVVNDDTELDDMAFKQEDVDYENFAEPFKNSDLYVYAKAIELNHSSLSQKQKHDVCVEFIENYGNNPYISSIQSIKNEIEEHIIKISNSAGTASDCLYPGTDENFKISYTNVKSINIELYKVDIDIVNYEKYDYNQIPDSKLQLIHKETLHFEDAGDFDSHTKDYLLAGQDYGIYLIKFSDPDCENLKIEKRFYVTRLFSCSRLTDGRKEVFVVDRKSGKPLCGAVVKVYKDGKRIENVKSGKMGIATLSKSCRYADYTVECGDDKFLPLQDISYYNDNYNSDDKAHTIVELFLDRGVYRPGQKVMAKGITYSKQGNDYKLQDGISIDVHLLDVNDEDVAYKKVVTNEYGSFYVEFDIPKGVMSGKFTISTSYGNKRFRVEEYKRPTFEVTVDNVAATTIDDTISVKGEGKYYRGVSTANANVQYTVTSSPVYYYRYPWVLPQIEDVVASGEGKCDADGMFTFKFVPEIAPENTHPFYRLNIQIYVTDDSGETESTSYSLCIGKTSYSLAVPLSGLVERNKSIDKAPKAFDAAGNAVMLSGEYVITSLSDSSEVTGEFITGRNIDLSALRSGRYSIKLTAFDDKMREVKFESLFTLYSESDKVPATESLIWMVPVKRECVDGEEAEFILGSSYDSHILMEVYSADSLVERSIVDIDSRCNRIKLKYRKEFSDRITVKLLAVHCGKAEKQVLTLSRRQKPRNLNIELSHLKKIYAPADRDRWRVRITDVDGNPIGSELLAAMYDLSLDAISDNNWKFNPVTLPYYFVKDWNFDNRGSINDSGSSCISSTSAYEFDYPSLSTPGSGMYYGSYYSYPSSDMRRLGKAGSSIYNSMASVSDEAEFAMDMVFSADEESIPLRSNFVETAFFYPQLNAEDGSVEIEFTAPEALTSWKIMLLAHNKELRTAVFTDTVITQKNLSVNLNLPRFVRTTDSLTLAATIDKLSQEIGDVDVKWRVEDALTEEIISTSNKIVVPKSASLLKVTVTAKSGNYTDGVEALLPVLSSQELVTESMPIILSKEGNFNYTFDSMAGNSSETLVNRGYSISLTPNAITLVLQSLPYVGEPQYNNAVDYTLAYYINHLASKAVADNSDLRAYLERLKAGEQSAKSPLEANEELKNILLQESPWVMDAQAECERNASLVELLDPRSVEAKQRKMLQKLFKLQNSDGGFAWFEGGKSAPYITLFVIEQLNKAGYSGPQMNRAEEYLVSEMQNGYNDAIDDKREPRATIFDIRAMMLMGKASNEASEYYYKQVLKEWRSYTLPEQALIAQLLNIQSDKAEAQNIIQNIRKFSVYKPNLGLYWPNTSNIYIQSEYIKAFAAVDPDAEELAKMKLWLLFNKQANQWGNSVATADAIDALISGGDAASGDSHIVIKVGDVTLDSDSAQWGESIDYKFPQADVSKNLAKVEVSKSGKDLTLGAAYWQYTEDIDKVEKHTDSRLTLKKEYYIERDGVLQPFDSEVGVNVGDKVTVRLVVSADRSMQCIHLRDLRPAGLEPVNQRSGYRIMSGLFYYETSMDCSTDFFFDYMPKGTYVFEYTLKANAAGCFAAGFATIESMYSSDFKSQTQGVRMVIK